MPRALRSLEALAPWGASVFVVLAACGPPGNDRDASVPDASLDAGTAETARVSVTLTIDPETLEDDTTLDRLELGVLRARAPNDRGRVERIVERSIDLTGGASEVMLSNATPGVYGEVELELGSGAWGPALVLGLTEPDRRIELVLEQRFEMEGRCDSPLELAAGHALELRARIDVAGIAHTLREAELPPPVDGVIRVDARTAPSVVTEVISRAQHLELDCDDDDRS